MLSSSIYDIREDRVSIKGKSWNDPLVQELAYKAIYLTQKMIDFWTPDLQRGERLFNSYDGKILTETQRTVYEEIESKVVIEPPIMKSPIRALLGQIIRAKRSGVVITEEGDYDDPFMSVDETKTVNITLKDLEKKTKEDMKIRDAVHDALISCYINVLLWQKRIPTGDNPLKYTLRKLPWNSCVFGPINFREPDCSDINELVFFELRSMAELIEAFPEQESNIVDHWGSGKIEETQICNIMHWDSTQDSRDISYIKGIIDAARINIRGPGGLVPTFQRIFQIKSKQEVWVNVTPYDDNEENKSLFEEDTYVVLPENWSEKRKNEWIEKNRDKYDGPYEKEVITLWNTVFTASGLVLYNDKHWFQDCGKLPATFIIPCMVNGRPSGPAIDMEPDALRNCVAQIEYLDDMRKGSGQILFTKEGYLTKESAENITEEANKSLGVVVLSKDSPSVADGYRIEKRQPNTAWRDYGEFAKQNMYENTRLNETMQGEAAPRQAAIAKETEIAQALIVSAIYMDNFNHQWQNHQNMKLAMIPYIYDESMQIVSAYDEEIKEDVTTMLNVPTYNQVTGEREDVLNDLTSRKYKWKISPVDDSPTAKVRMMQDALLIINGAFGPLMQGDPSGKFFATFLSALDNPMLNKAGKALEKDAQARQQQAGQAAQAQNAVEQQKNQINLVKAMAEMEKAKKAGVTMNFTGEQIAQYPNLYAVYQQLVGNLGAMGGMVPAPGPGMDQPGQMAMTPQPAMAGQPM